MYKAALKGTKESKLKFFAAKQNLYCLYILFGYKIKIK